MATKKTNDTRYYFVEWCNENGILDPASASEGEKARYRSEIGLSPPKVRVEAIDFETGHYDPGLSSGVMPVAESCALFRPKPPPESAEAQAWQHRVSSRPLSTKRADFSRLKGLAYSRPPALFACIQNLCWYTCLSQAQVVADPNYRFSSVQRRAPVPSEWLSPFSPVHDMLRQTHPTLSERGRREIAFPWYLAGNLGHLLVPLRVLQVVKGPKSPISYSVVPRSNKLERGQPYPHPLPILSQEQLNVVRSIIKLDRPVVVRAGPGTGKTHTIMAALAKALIIDKVSLGDVRVLTFSRQAAREAHSRLADILRSTYHYFDPRIKDIVSVLDSREQYKSRVVFSTIHSLAKAYLQSCYGDSVNNVLVEESDIDNFMRRALKRLCPRSSNPSARERKDIWDAVNRYRLTGVNPRGGSLIPMLSSLLESELESRGQYDFTRYLKDAVTDSDFVPLPQYKLVIVDEFQDLNSYQYLLAKRSCFHGTLVVIGDPSQRIYSFQGAMASGFRDFEQDFPEAHQFSLAENRRSSKAVVDKINQTQRALDPALWPQFSSDGKDAGVVMTYTTDDKMYRFASKVKSLLKGGTPASEIAVLVRSIKYPNEGLVIQAQVALREEEVPISTPRDDESDSIRAGVALSKSQSTDSVILSTIHQAKGKEYDYVFLIGAESEVLPHPFAAGTSALMDEHHLYYTALSRARHAFFVVHREGKAITKFHIGE